MAGAPHIFIAAGEVSGDVLGGDLIAALMARQPQLQISGIGGEKMTKQGLVSLFPMEEIAVIGIFPVLARLPNILRRVKQTLAHIMQSPPDVVVLIDSPGFMHHLAKRIRRRLPHIPIICYVAPQVWAWRRGRARSMSAYCNAVLALLPFEPAIFAAEPNAPPCYFVGHPALGRMTADTTEGVDDFRTHHNMTADTPLLCVLAGSRLSEVKRLAPIFGKVVANLASTMPTLRLCMPVVAHLRDDVQRLTGNWAVQPIFMYDEAEKYAAFRTATAALAASGTVSLELAICRTPMVVAYDIGFVSQLMLARLINIPSAVLANLILDKPIVQEFLGDDCTAANITPEIGRLLRDPQANQAMRQALAPVAAMLQPAPNIAPADAAAAIVLKYLND